MKIYIDAGHRNNRLDYGAIGNGQKESALALSICKKLKAKLEKHSIVVYMSRESENDIISLMQRTVRANNLKVDLYLSVHINSAQNTQASGIEVLYYDTDMLASKLCDNICEATGACNRGAKKRTDLYILNATRAKAILVECGFISNATECNKLTTNFYQNKIAEAIVEVLIKEYKISIPMQDDELCKAVNKIIASGVSINATAWNKVENINLKNVPALINKLGSLDKLEEDKVISSKVLWESKEYKINHVKALLIKYASRIG